MSRKATILTLLFSLPLLALGQACTGCDSTRQQFSSHSVAVQSSGGGDGEPLDNKPEPGLYYRIIPGFLCNGQPRVAGTAEITNASVRLSNLAPGTCVETKSELTLDQVQHSNLSPNLLGVGLGIYARSEQVPDIAHLTAPVTEALCRYRPSSGPALDLIVTQDFASRKLIATVAGAKFAESGWSYFPAQSLEVGRDVRGATYRIEGAGFSLFLPKTFPGSTSAVTGHLKTTYAGAIVDADLLCRSGSIFDVNSPVTPSYSADFGGGSLPPGFSFSRAGAASYFDAGGAIALASANSPRFDHDPVNKNALGLLLEETRTNLLTHSSDLNDSVWGLNGTQTLTITKDGLLVGLNRFRIQKTQQSGTIYDRVLQTANVTAGTVYTVSFFAQAGSVPGARVFIWRSAGDETNVDFDLASGSAIVYRQNVITTRSTSTVPVQNGYRVSVTFVSSVTDAINVGIGPRSGDKDDYIYATGAQLEVGASSTSYIPTIGAAVTRGEDRLSLLDLVWFQPSAGTFASDVSRPGAEALAPAARAKVFSFSGAGDEFAMTFDPGATFSARMSVGASGGEQALSSAPAAGPSAVQRLVLAYAPGDSAAALGGAVTRLPASFPVGLIPTRLDLGGPSTAKWNAHLKSIMYWPQRIDDLKLDALAP